MDGKTKHKFKLKKPNLVKILARIDKSIESNKKVESIYIGLLILLFLVVVTCFIISLTTKNYELSIISFITTTSITWPLKQLKALRRQNIYLTTIPAMLELLTPKEASIELKKLFGKLYDEK